MLGLLVLLPLLSAQAREQSLLVLGDSISAAYGMSLEEGWVAQLSEHLGQREPPVEVVNASISGETSAGALRRLPALLAQHQPGVVIIELGGNDGLRGYPLPSFRSNLSSLTSLATESGASVVILPMEIPPNYGTRYTEGFRDSFKRVAEETGSLIAPFILHGVATEPNLMQADGIHPKAEAQSVMLQNVLPTIEEALQ